MELILNPIFFFTQISSVIMMILTEYCNGLLVKYKNVKVNYTRKINHFILVLVPIYFNRGFAFQEEYFLYTIGASLAVLKFIFYIKPIRDRIAIINTMFKSFDRPEDRPNTLLWLSTQMATAYMVLIPMTILFNHYNIQHLIYIPILIWGIGDGLAEPVGIKFGKHKYNVSALFNGKKYYRTLEGSMCVFLTGLLVIAAYQKYFTTSQFIWALLIIPALMTIAEAFSPHTWDSPLMYLTGYLSLFGIMIFI